MSATSPAYLGFLCRAIAAVKAGSLDPQSVSDEEKDKAEHPTEVGNEKTGDPD